MKLLHKDVNIYEKPCIECGQGNVCPQCYAQLHLEELTMPIHFIVMDLIGKFKPSPKGHQYALTVIDMLTNYTWCILLFTK